MIGVSTGVVLKGGFRVNLKVVREYVDFIGKIKIFLMGNFGDRIVWGSG